MLIQPKADLYDRVVNRINREEKIAEIKIKLIFRFFGLLLSCFVLVPLSFMLFSDISESGFLNFLSLICSDFSAVMLNTGDYILSLLEIMPLPSLIFSSVSLLVSIFFLAKLADCYVDFKKILTNY
ncbi:MAG: hypothetical protein V1667_02655 [bacterium]